MNDLHEGNWQNTSHFDCATYVGWIKTLDLTGLTVFVNPEQLKRRPHNCSESFPNMFYLLRNFKLLIFLQFFMFFHFSSFLYGDKIYDFFLDFEKCFLSVFLIVALSLQLFRHLLSGTLRANDVPFIL